MTHDNKEVVAETRELTAVEKIQADIRAKAKIAKEAGIIKRLQTATGAELFINQEDVTKLMAIRADIEKATAKPIYPGFRFDQTSELIIAIASGLQFAGKDAREHLASYYEVFTPGIRDTILGAYGNLPYIKRPTLLDIEGDGVLKEMDPDGIEYALEGQPADIEKLQVVCEMVQDSLGLIGTMNITQAKQDRAWSDAKKKVLKQQLLEEYKENTDTEEEEIQEKTDEEYLAELVDKQQEA